MDPRSFTIDTARELRLRRHIREVLLPYARTHLTSDHVAFTETVVEQLLLQTLEYVPMADPTSFLLPTEPFEVLIQSLNSLDFTPVEEKWVIPSEHIRYLKSCFPPPLPSTDLRTEKAWSDDNHYLRLSLMCRPTSPPVLSKVARRETPKLGGSSSRASIPRTKSALSAFLDLHPVTVKKVKEPPTPPVDDVLDLRFKLESTAEARVRPFLRSLLAPPTGDKSFNYFDDTPNVPEFLSRDSPQRRLPSLASPPLFPRVARRHSSRREARDYAGSGVSNPICTSDLVSMLQVAPPQLMSSEDGDINGRHMEVVNGWTTLAFSSPPPPSLHSSDESEVDELWDVSPPGTPATSLMAAKMDEVEIPRVRKFGHRYTSVGESINDRSTAGLLTNNPGFFITSFISASIPIGQAVKPPTAHLGGVKPGMHSHCPLSPDRTTSNSLLGQPPAPDEQSGAETPAGHVERVEDFEEQPLDDAVASIYALTPQDPFFYIREEKLDEMEITLMDVPNLPPPTAHAKEPILVPTGLQCFVAPKGDPGRLDTAQYESNGLGPMKFLRPVKGIKPLALDLSWRPFNFGKSIPTDEEVAAIVEPIRPEDEGPGYRDIKYEKAAHTLLGTASISAEGDQLTFISAVPRVCEEFGTSPIPKRSGENELFEYLLTQRERARASRAKIALEGEVGIQNDADDEQDAPWSHDDQRGDIDILTQGNDEQQGSQIPLDPMAYHFQNWTDHGYSLEDSGINIMDNNLCQFPIDEYGTHPLQEDSLYGMDLSGANENINNPDENEERIPLHAGDTQLTEDRPDPPASQYDWSSYFEFPLSATPPFEPLSFPSQSQRLGISDHFTNLKAQEAPPLTPSARRVEHTEDALGPSNECEETDLRAAKRRRLDDLVPASSKGLFSTFIGLRNQVTSSRNLEHSESRNDTPTPHLTHDVPEQMLPRGAPDDVFDPHTVRLPEHWVPAAVVHRYLASMALIQKRALVRALQGHEYRVALVERYDLGGTDIIVDLDYGVLFIPLFALPATLDAAVDRISRESWRFLNLLVVFEAFPSAQSYRADHARDNRPIPYAYTPPICKAVKKLRRNLGIAEGCGTMNPRCTVTWAFADEVEEAAKFVRCFGEEACAISTERGQGMLWDDRTWLEKEEQEGESDLARVDGMNVLAAFVMLYDRTLDTILDMSPEARLADYGQLFGQERVTGLNAIIESRIQQMAPDLLDHIADPRC